MKKLLFILLFCSISFSVFCELRFYREDIHFSLTDTSFTINGYYFLRNELNNDIKQIFYYPFPQDSLYGLIDTIVCENISRPDSAKVIRWDQKGASLQITIAAHDTTVMRISYVHKLKGGKAEYILNTTSLWGRGFEQAYYDLIFSKKIKINSISYIPDDLIDTKTHYKLIWQKENFLPLENFIVEFEI